MKLRVKHGRVYYSGGKEYKAGEEVEVEEKNVTLLTWQKGPLEHLGASKPADLPKAAYETRHIKAAQEAPAPLAPSSEDTPTESETDRSKDSPSSNQPAQRGSRRTYSRRDMTPEK